MLLVADPNNKADTLTCRCLPLPSDICYVSSCNSLPVLPKQATEFVLRADAAPDAGLLPLLRLLNLSGVCLLLCLCLLLMLPLMKMLFLPSSKRALLPLLCLLNLSGGRLLPLPSG